MPNTLGDVPATCRDDDANNDDASGDRRVLLARLASWPKPFQRMRGVSSSFASANVRKTIAMGTYNLRIRDSRRNRVLRVSVDLILAFCR